MTTYSTSFPSAPENPVSEGGAFFANSPTNGFTALKTVATPNRAVGTQGALGNPDDSYSTLTAAFSANHQIQGTVYNADLSGGSEIELHLRFADTSTTATGYECNIQCSGGYYQIVQWLGAEGSFSVIAGNQSAPYPAGTMPPATGDIMQARMYGSEISVGINKSPSFAGFQELTAVNDTLYTTGKPGLGTFFNGGTQNNAGWSSITATDLSGPQVRQSLKISVASTSVSANLPQTVLAGSVVVVAAAATGSTSFSTLTITDGSSDTFTDSGQGAIIDSGLAISRMGAFLSPTTGVQNFVATSNAVGSPTVELWVWEIVGLSAPFSIDQVAVASGSGTTASSGSTATLSSNQEVAFGLIVAAAGVLFPGINWMTGGSGKTTHGDLGQYQPLNTTAAVTSTAPITSGSWRAWVLTLMGTSQQVLMPQAVM